MQVHVLNENAIVNPETAFNKTPASPIDKPSFPQYEGNYSNLQLVLINNNVPILYYYNYFNQ